MPKYIDADDFLLQYSILTSRPSFMPFSAEMSTWELWKQEFDRSVQMLVSRMITEQENGEQKVVAKIKEIPVAQIPIVCCKDCKYWQYKCQGDCNFIYGDCLYWAIEHNSDYYMETTGEHYCGFAERRESE